VGETELTYYQRTVLRSVKRQARHGDPVPTGVVREATAGVVPYDAVDRSLKALVRLGLISKPSRGFYLPVEEASSDA